MTRIFALIVLLFAALPYLHGQPTLSFDLKKPKKFENRKLGSEKTEEKKFTLMRRFTQNGVTKFNWHFNAKMKLADVLARAKAMHKDDYNKLLTFYNYTLEATARDRVELDSVIYKANAGILIHDLRNAWIDNLYMLMGEAYYYRNALDTAYLTFQYINYAFSPKEKDGYDIPIGSNAVEGGNAFSISTKENRTLAKKIWARPPSRNESFIWQIRTALARDEMGEAAGLIETLRNDPNFPERLHTDLSEVRAWWFYKQTIYDSAAIYLSQALDNAQNREEKARWQYLIGQLYERANDREHAAEYFEKAVATTLDPVLEVYGRLNTIRQHKGDEKVIQQNIDELVKMGRKDKYLAYRDIIYYAAAEMELERNNIDGAKAFLLRATATANPDGSNSMRTKAFLLLAELSYKQKDYPEAKRFYDSITQVPPELADPTKLMQLRSALARVVEQQLILNRQDSMQRLAAMPEAARDAFIKKLVKQLRKQRGIKGDDSSGGAASGGPLFDDNNAKPVDLFGANAKGEWYFYNNALKAKGFTEFKGRWGNRPNMDNWRRLAGMKQPGGMNIPGAEAMEGMQAASEAGSGAITFDELLKRVPLTPEQMAVSNDSVERAQFMLGKVYLEGLEDYASTITILESFLDKFPKSSQRPEALFMLAYCYHKTGDLAKEKAVQDELKQKFPGSSFEKIVSNPGGVSPDSMAKADATKRYDAIYNLFIEGSFDQALAQKKAADSLYGSNYWTPQLLYIQSVYFIKQRMDDSAKKVLNDITRLFANSPMTPKARALIDVLNRRAQIEDYLTKLQIERPAEDSSTMPDDAVAAAPTPQQPVVRDSVVKTAPPVAQPRRDSLVTAARPQQPAVDSGAIVRNQPPPPVPTVVSPATQPALTRTDTTTALRQVDRKAQPPVAPPIVQQPQQPVVVRQDTARNRPATVTAPPARPQVLAAESTLPHYVAILLDKVDPVYINEARNAFTRYNRERFGASGYSVNNVVITDDVKIVLIGAFENANAAIEYVDKTRKLAATEIVPWLPAAKYSFTIITNNNLEVLKNTKDVEAFRRFLGQTYPGKF